MRKSHNLRKRLNTTNIDNRLTSRISFDYRINQRGDKQFDNKSNVYGHESISYNKYLYPQAYDKRKINI